MPKIAYERRKEPGFLTIYQAVNYFVLEVCSLGFQSIRNTHLVTVLASLSYSFSGLQPQHLWAGEYPNLTGIISISLHNSSVRLTLSSSLFLRGGSGELDCICDFPNGRGHLCITAIIFVLRHPYS